jgi:hypothetical protein
LPDFTQNQHNGSYTGHKDLEKEVLLQKMNPQPRFILVTIIQKFGAGGVTQVVDYLLSKCKA